MNCSNCLHFKAGLISTAYGECRRYPPTTHVWKDERWDGPQYEQTFPQVSDADICGEYKEKLSASAKSTKDSPGILAKDNPEAETAISFSKEKLSDRP